MFCCVYALVREKNKGLDLNLKCWINTLLNMKTQKILSVAICLLFQMRSTNAEVEQRQVVFTSKAESLLYEKTPISVKKSDSLISCSHYCTRDKRCKSANFVKSDRACSLLNKTRITHPKSFLREQVGAIHLEKVNADLGSTQELAVSSCRSLSSSIHSSGVYWVDPDGGSQINAFKVYCDMDTDGGGWTLVWSYTFTNYASFNDKSNAITPRPNWPAKWQVNVPISTTPPLNETDYNAMTFSQWKQIGRRVLIKSNINNWLVCDPRTGSLVDWQDGSVSCHIVKRISDTCKFTPGPSNFDSMSGFGPKFVLTKPYYFFDGYTLKSWPTHDPCGTNSESHLKNVADPHGNIFIR